MVKTFTVKPTMVEQIEFIGAWLDECVTALYNTGWKIISIKPTNIPLYDYDLHKRVYGPMYIIVAEGGDCDAFEKEMAAD